MPLNLRKCRFAWFQKLSISLLATPSVCRDACAVQGLFLTQYAYAGSAGFPFLASHVSQPRTHKHQRGMSVRETANHARSTPDLAIQPIERVICTQVPPVFRWKALSISLTSLILPRGVTRCTFR